MIRIKSKTKFHKTEEFLKHLQKSAEIGGLERYGAEGVDALSSATPINTGLTAGSWSYEIRRSKDRVSIVFKNSNVVDNVPIAIIIQYGHGTGNGGYVQGIDYINPAIRPIFERIRYNVWKEVTKR